MFIRNYHLTMGVCVKFLFRQITIAGIMRMIQLFMGRTSAICSSFGTLCLAHIMIPAHVISRKAFQMLQAIFSAPNISLSSIYIENIKRGEMAERILCWSLRSSRLAWGEVFRFALPPRHQITYIVVCPFPLPIFSRGTFPNRTVGVFKFDFVLFV